MGNQCCTKRQKLIETPPPKIKRSKIPKVEISTAMLPLDELESPTKPLINRMKTFGGITHPIEEEPIKLPGKVSPTPSESEQSEYILEYSLNSISHVSVNRQKQLLDLLNSFKFTVQNGYEEVDSQIEATLHLNESHSTEVMLILTTKSLYFVNPLCYTESERRLALEDILAICVDKSITSGVIHGKKTVIEGDSWVTCPKLEDLIFALQNFYFSEFGHYLPTYSTNKNELPSKLNRLAFSMIQAYENPIFCLLYTSDAADE